TLTQSRVHLGVRETETRAESRGGSAVGAGARVVSGFAAVDSESCGGAESTTGRVGVSTTGATTESGLGRRGRGLGFCSTTVTARGRIVRVSGHTLATNAPSSTR